MPRPNAEQKFQTMLEETVRAILDDKEATIAEKLKAVAEGRALLEITVPKRRKSEKDMFE